MYVCIYVYICLFIYSCIYVCVCIYAYITYACVHRLQPTCLGGAGMRRAQSSYGFLLAGSGLRLEVQMGNRLWLLGAASTKFTSGVMRL